MPAETHVERTPLGPDEILALIRERLAVILEIDEARITRDARFADDLEADSLALIELVEELEEELGERTVGFRVDDEDLADLHTVREAATVITPRLLEAAEAYDPEVTGGAVLLGVDGVCVISHGNSSRRAVVSAVQLAADCVGAGAVRRMQEAVAHAG